MISNSPAAYHFKEEIRRRVASMGFVKRAGRDVPDLKLREAHQLYLRAIDRQLRNQLGAQSRWGDVDTYDHNRKPPGKCMRNDRGTGDYSRMTF